VRAWPQSLSLAFLCFLLMLKRIQHGGSGALKRSKRLIVFVARKSDRAQSCSRRGTPEIQAS
jgi:hypothetical protein